MEKTIENLKKFLHIGPRSEKKEIKGILPQSPEKSAVNVRTNSWSVERRSDDEVERQCNATQVSNFLLGTDEDDVFRVHLDVPLAGDELEEEDDDTLEKCEGCKGGMRMGKEVTLSNGLSWHYNCFSCELCGVELSSRKYAYNNCLLCEPCIRAAVRTTCFKCILAIEMNDTKLIVDGKEFHQNCFKCSHCSSQLDSVYGRKEGQYYCETCYVQIAGKKCSDCGQCWRCGTALSQGAHSVKGRPVCPDCYEETFMETCAVCQQPVTQGILFRQQRFHQSCFKCRTCGLLLDKDIEFLLTPEGLQCKECLVSVMGEQEGEGNTENCTSCSLPIHVKDLVSDGEKSWHFKCFVCIQCNTSLVGSKYYDKQDSLYCNNCFLAEHSPTCYYCKVQLKGKGGVKMSAKSGQVLTWHEECLKCSVCLLSVSLDNVVFKEKLFCKSCYIENNLNKCDKCTKVITGEGFTFRAKFWHDTCFGCDRCPFIFHDGKFRILREEKLCDNCFKTATNVLQQQ